MAASLVSTTSFTVNVNLTDGQEHRLGLYAIDYENTGAARVEQIEIVSAMSGAVLDSRLIPSFGAGVYLQWNVAGNVKIIVTNEGPGNAVLSGIFLDVPTLPAAAVFLKQDTATEGNWIGTYGAQGYELIGNAVDIPSYATVTASGLGTDIWSSSATTMPAVEDAAGTAPGRTAACWNSGTSFTVDVNLTDGQTHDLELYFLDWDGTSLRRASDTH